ncbi:MAG: HAMP domain-containing histidine kinase, partial [Chloroflexota bacterium]|nr:HAMP domain-containing histidine kinase [Chloroflexota bacterium]
PPRGRRRDAGGSPAGDASAVAAEVPPPTPPALYRFLDRALFGLEWGTMAVLLAITLIRPTTSRLGLPTWGLVVAFAGYTLLANVAQHRAHTLQALRQRCLLDLPVTALVYFLGGEPGGPLFLLFVLAIDCAAAGMTLRGTLLYTAAAAATAGASDVILAGGAPPPADLRPLLTRLALLPLVGLGMAILTRRLLLEREAARSLRDEAQRLEALDRLRADFIATVSHDLRTPLTAIRAGLGMLETGLVDRLPPDERQLLRDARRNTERLGRLIDDLLALNQLEAGTLRLEREPLDLRAIAGSAIASVHSLARQKGQTLAVDLPAPLPAEGDPRRLEQAVVNLLANAHQHTPPGTRIAVAGRATDREVRLTVSDNGPGIPAGELEHIFRRFHRVAPAGGGSGLGLAIARGIVALHGGRLWAESGRGAAFHVALPRRTKGNE